MSPLEFFNLKQNLKDLTAGEQSAILFNMIRSFVRLPEQHTKKRRFYDLIEANNEEGTSNSMIRDDMKISAAETSRTLNTLKTQGFVYLKGGLWYTYDLKGNT